MKQPHISQYSLTKVKLIKGGGLAVTYDVIETIGDETFSDNNTVKSTKEPHPDLYRVLNDIKEVAADLIGLNEPLVLAKAKKMSASVKFDIEAFVKHNKENLKINGVSLAGAMQKRVALLVVYEPKPGQALAMNPRVTIDSEDYPELENMIEELEKETYEYLFEGKRAQLEIAFEDNEPDGLFEASE